MMRTSAWRMFGLAAVGCVAVAAGCRSAVDDFYDPLAAGGAAGSGGTGGTGGIPQECQGDPTKEPGIVRDGCGVFVDATAPTGGDGSKAAPLKSVAEAAKKAKGRIFVCARAGTEAYAEAETIELASGVSIYGGFGECPADGAWLWDSDKRALIGGPADMPVMQVAGGKAHLEGVDLSAPDAVTPGGSSIALLAESADVDIVNAHFLAGKGAAGEAGVMSGEIPAIGAAADSNSPTAACVMNTITAGVGALNACSDGDSQGGDGGKGGTVPANNGDPGMDGTPLPADNPLGEGLGGTVDAMGVCTDGKSGRDGDLGESGVGGTEMGTLTANGIAGGEGGDGKPGARGQGGGGGGGSKAGVFCGSPAVAGAGASGGGGGAGGCGGKGGTGGRAGGSSIGLISLGSTFTFSGVLVRTADGGKGGAGGPGVTGAGGGKGATGGLKAGGTSKAGCDGGSGGDGGNGGTGGGGRGGHSLGIAFLGEAPSIEAGISFEGGAAGEGGLGDPTVMNDGAEGTAADMLSFGTP